MIDSLNIDLLQVFITVSEHNSINKSSEILLLSQPAISKKIKQLEEYFDTKLFTRTPQGMKLTPTGKTFYSKAKVVLEDFQSLHNIEKEDTPLSKIRIGSLDNIASIHYPDFFKTALFKARSLKLSNEVLDLVDPFNEEKIDLIFLDSQFSRLLTINYEEKFLYSEPYVVVYSDNNQVLKNTKKDILTSQDLQKLNLIMHPKLCPVHDKLVSIFTESRLSLPEIYEVDFVESRISLVAISDLITILPKSLAERKIQNNSSLHLKKLDTPFIRNVSIFGNNKVNLDKIYHSIEN
ncbi:LysR family transcriptional regulator [Lactobacillus sp.]|uniref:LysR family transcriptional regulator n=1 Tax=Lactobacillus sp. TaxID=1591 RepID=UPI00199F870D|nr:LysR family transcriptional regulator [Lactobacillus sp.]MBD5429447.1 LysR family transcriptional regulator [Lactobacillus sp.]